LQESLPAGSANAGYPTQSMSVLPDSPYEVSDAIPGQRSRGKVPGKNPKGACFGEDRWLSCGSSAGFPREPTEQGVSGILSRYLRIVNCASSAPDRPKGFPVDSLYSV
jgi:hypothetical protein